MIMSTIELRKRLIARIEHIEDEKLLEEAYRLLEIESEDLEVYKLNTDQKNAIRASRAQIKRGELLTEEQANQDIDEWLEK